MDATFLIIMAGQVIGPTLLLVGVVVLISKRWRRSVAFALLASIAMAATVAAANPIVPYTQRAVFWAAFALCAGMLGATILVAFIISTTDGAAKDKHAA